ncbi:MAG: hypothetical protein NVSMB66_2320 [Candidatus Doudnabacteria bacterium]
MDYTLKISKKARNIRLAVYLDGRIVLTVPRNVSIKEAEKFFLSRKEWITEKQANFQKRESKLRIGIGKNDYAEQKVAALRLAKERVEHFNKLYKFDYGVIRVRNQKSRWGSCSKKGNLTFNYRIVLLPTELADYIIVHELCHTKEFNHSARFWALVALEAPEYKKYMKELRKYSLR